MNAPITDHAGLVRALRARRQSLGLSQLAVDHISGMAEGYCAKIEASLTNPTAKNARSIGRESLPLMLGALGVGMVLVKNGAMPASSEHTISDSNPNEVAVTKQSFFIERARMGALKANAMRSAAQRKAIARKAAKARWADRSALVATRINERKK